MSYGLAGPYPLDLKTVLACGRDALAAAGRALRQGTLDEAILAGGAATEPGLYVLIDRDDSGKAEVLGFWVVPGGDYLTVGPLGPPDRVPPFVQELLDAATEEVWWQSLVVRRAQAGTWRPLVVLEWQAHFANRSALAPPGVPFVDLEGSGEGAGEDRETWLEAVSPSGSGFRTAGNDFPHGDYERDGDRFGHLPETRSLVAVVCGSLHHDGRLHTGSYFMVPPEMFEDGRNDLLPMESWIEEALRLTDADVEALDLEDDRRHHCGKPLALPGGRVGFHASGWLTRGLGVWPARPADIVVGGLTDRVVQQKWIAQARLALSSSVVVLTSVLAFSAVVQAMTRPVAEPLEPPPPPAAQPAMSVCSADYQEFVDEFRCQIAELARRGDQGPVTPICGDKGSSTGRLASSVDLQADYCGLLDRALDGWTADLGRGDRAAFAEFAASQACFNVLGHPYPYQLRQRLDVKGEEWLSNTNAFLKDDNLGILPLSQLVTELKTACDTYRERSESLVEGAVFASHIGGPVDLTGGGNDAGRLRQLAVSRSVVGMSNDVQVCFNKGVRDGLVATHYQGMCTDEPDMKDRRYLGVVGEVKAADGTEPGKEAPRRGKVMWAELNGDVPSSIIAEVVDRYAAARFAWDGPGKSSFRVPPLKALALPLPDLWACHVGLLSGDATATLSRIGLPSTNLYGMWEIRAPIPLVYDVSGRGGANNQLTLDSTLRAIADAGLDAGTCWRVVAKRVSNYKPVHPLLSELLPEGWPSEEQQLCGQVCASRYNLRRSLNDSDWVTRDTDLSQCVLRQPGPPEDGGGGGLDRLRLPWNDPRRGEWVEPDPEQVCAFNVVAQDLMPPMEGGYVVQERPGKEFAGETYAGSRIVGGDLGLAARYVQGLAFGRMDAVTSAAACGHVATQCFTGLMLEVTGDPTIERYRWLEQWRRKIESLAQLRRPELAEDDPWCVGIKDYLIPQPQTAQFDTPCVSGVEEARSHTEAAFRILETGVPVGGNGG